MVLLKAGKKDKRQVNENTSNLEREYRDCRRDKIGMPRHIIMHQVVYIVQLPNEEGDVHTALGAL